MTEPDADPPRAQALVMRLVLRGRGADLLIGDILERYAEDLEAGHSSRTARARLWRQIALSAVVWWSPRVVLDRWRDGSNASKDLVVRLGARRRGQRPIPSLAGWRSDLKLGVRTLARRPGYSLAVAATLGIGISAATTVFSVVNGVLLRPLPYGDPSSLMIIGELGAGAASESNPGDLLRLSGPNFLDVSARAGSFATLAAVEPNQWPLEDVGNGPELLASARVSPGFFRLLGVSPVLGRTFLPDDAVLDAEPTAMLSYGAWQRRYGGSRDVVGQTVERSAVPAVIIGVLPPDFDPPEAIFPVTDPPEIWVPIALEHSRYQDRARPAVYALGRLSPGSTVESAHTELETLARRLATEYPETNRRADGSPVLIGAGSLRDRTVGTANRPLALFLGAAILLLLLSAMNAATLFLARGLDRTGEIAVRAALGARRSRLVRLLLAEAGVLSVTGGLLGVLTAYAGVEAFVRFAPSSIPRLNSVGVDPAVLTVAALTTLGAGLLAGLVPALRLSRGGGNQPTGDRSGGDPHARLRALLVGSQVGVAIVLLSIGSLLFASFVHLRGVDPGFEEQGVLAMRVDLEGFARSSPDRFTSVWAGWDIALAELGSVPGVEDIEAASNIPLQAPGWAPRVLLPDDEAETWREGIAGYVVTPGYFDLMGIRVVDGRAFERLDGPDAERVAVVNESFVLTQMGGRDPLNATLIDRDGLSSTQMRIVGVVEDVVQARQEDGSRPAVYMPYTQVSRAPWVVLRTDRALDAILPDLRRAAARFNPIVPLQEVMWMEDRMAAARTSPRFQTLLIGSFSVFAVLLAGLGLYGSLTHTVGRRRKEMGVRIALGASPRHILGTVIAQGLRVTGAGVGMGVLVTLGLSGSLDEFLYGVRPHDPLVLFGAATGFMAIAGLACYLPARRASAVEPSSVLTTE